VKRIFVDSFGEGSEAAALRDALVARIGTGGQFALVASYEAQATLARTRSDPGTVSIELVSAAGEVLWRGSRAVPTGEAPAVTAAAIGDELLAAARAPTASHP
jgi:hypothetical protein